MNQYLKLIIVFFIPVFQSCFSTIPDCDDVNKQDLMYELMTYQNDQLYKEQRILMDSLKSHWKEQGYKTLSLYEQYNLNMVIDGIDKIINDSLGPLWDESVVRLDTIWNFEKKSILSTISNLKLLDEVKLISESENSNLTKFHCYCQIKYELDGENGDLEYKLTRIDWDSRTYQEVNYSTLKFNSIITNQVWESLIK